MAGDHVLIALADVGHGVQLEETLASAGFTATWTAAAADGPLPGVGTPSVVLVDADRLGARLPEVADAWRDQPSVPGVVAFGSTAAAREAAPRARVSLLSPGAKLTTIVTAIREAAKMRLASGMRWPVMRAAVGLPPTDDDVPAWRLTLSAARGVDIDIPRTALRWHVHHYVTPTARLAQLLEERILTVPELESARKIDGTLTVQSTVKIGPLDPMQMARLLWALISVGALEVSPEITNVATPGRRMLSELRAHLRARTTRLERSTYYDVLEITPLADYPEIEAAYALVGRRYHPDVVNRYDLAEVAPLVAPSWELVEKARAVLIDDPARGRYHDWLRQKLAELKTTWAIDPKAVQAASVAFTRGQKLLGEGDVHRAMSELAMACRHHPGHPDYEANRAWARYRVQVASGRDREEAARAEKAGIEATMLGCRPWPRALVALALICVAAGDADSARWHLSVALSIDPNVPAGVQLATRLGMIRR
ncbi:MAG: DnaJ domain-containing protein [Proteobacteria bacterium]|nr:DnaJ domain-containing protein [Pseudomonadota bacterium]